MSGKWGRSLDGPVDAAITKAIGVQLMLAREDHGWSQADLAARTPSGLHVKTLATYEQGARRIPIVRLVELCMVLEISAPTVLARALRHANLHLRDNLCVDLRAILASTLEELQSMRRWARNRLARDPATTLVDLSQDTVVEMAASLGYTHLRLVAYLEAFAPAPLVFDGDGGPAIEGTRD